MIKHYSKVKEFLLKEFNFRARHLYYHIKVLDNQLYYIEISSNNYVLGFDESDICIENFKNFHYINSTNGFDNDEWFNYITIDDIFVLTSVQNISKIREFMVELVSNEK